MLQDTILWTLALAVVAVLVIGLVLPGTRPYAKRYWWAAVGIACMCIAAALLRRKKPGSPVKAIEGGKIIAQQNLDALDKVADYAEEQKILADADLTKARLESASAREAFDAQLATLGLIEDSLERRKALIKLVERTK